MSNRVFSTGAFVITFALASIVSAPGHAADYSIPSTSPAYAASADPVEFGSGWYIRGDLGGTQSQHIGVSNVPSFDTTNPAVNPQAPGLLSGQSKRLSYDAGLGAGYQFNRWFRADLTANFLEPSKSTATANYNSCYNNVAGNSGLEQCYTNLNSSIHEYAALANGYVDLGHWSIFTPYVGAGAGLSFGHFSTASVWSQANQTPFTRTFQCITTSAVTCSINWDRTSASTYYNLAWALMAGVSIDVYDHTKLDIGYRYLNLGSITSDSGKINLNDQEVRFGLRYMIDN